MPDSNPVSNPVEDTTPDVSTSENGNDSTNGNGSSPTRKNSDLNKKHLADISLGEDVAAAGLDEDRLVMLASQEIEESTLTGIITMAEDTRTVGQKVVAAKEDKKRKTKTEQEAKEKLMTGLRGIQTGVKRKFPKDKIKWAAYRIGKSSFGNNRIELEQDAKVILDLAAEDELKGITTEKLTEIRALLKAWVKADEEQDAAEAKVTDLLKEFEENVGEINAARRDVQYAADTAWPYKEEKNAGTRRALKLPANRPLS